MLRKVGVGVVLGLAEVSVLAMAKYGNVFLDSAVLACILLPVHHPADVGQAGHRDDQGDQHAELAVAEGPP